MFNSFVTAQRAMLVHSQILRSLISYELKELQRIQQELLPKQHSLNTRLDVVFLINGNTCKFYWQMNVLYIQQVYDYLVDTAASVQTRESINEFLTSVKQYDLAKAEALNILNIGPAADFELYPVSINILIFQFMLHLSIQLEVFSSAIFQL